MKKESIALIVFGCALLLIGLGAYFYRENLNPGGTYIMYEYPYQTLGLILSVAGILVTSIGLLKTKFS